jgi:hypothetical protein
MSAYDGLSGSIKYGRHLTDDSGNNSGVVIADQCVPTRYLCVWEQSYSGH